MKLVKTVQALWFYFRMGNGLYLSFPLGFLGNMAVIYELVLKQLPYFASLHLWGFTLTFGLLYFLVGSFVGNFHMKTQNMREAELAGPMSPWNYKMLPVGKEAKLGMPSSLTNIKIQIRMLQWMDQVSKRLNIEMPEFSEFNEELGKYKKMTETLLEGGEVR